jgi:uncharacterized protein (TIGR03435 family)
MIRGAAQSQAFDVASVKPNTSGNKRASIQMNLPDGFTTTNQTLHSLISMVYQVPIYRMSGGPDWLKTATWDIAAKADHRITIDEKRQMIRALFEDRFKLKTHRESHDGRIYALVLARSDGKPGPNLKPSSLDCAAIAEARRQAGSAAPAPTPANPVPACGAIMGPNLYKGQGVQIAGFANTLAAMMREMVVDETGLTGWFDISLTMTLDAASPDGPPSVFTAVQEQLGLKLEPRRGPVETFVIDSAERPTSD